MSYKTCLLKHNTFIELPFSVCQDTTPMHSLYKVAYFFFIKGLYVG